MSININCKEYNCNELNELFVLGKEHGFIKPESINNFSCHFKNIHFLYYNNVVAIMLDIQNEKDLYKVYENKWLIDNFKIINQIDNFLKKLKTNVDNYNNDIKKRISNKLDDIKINFN